jgi:hypothetical protein
MLIVLEVGKRQVQGNDLFFFLAARSPQVAPSS